MRIWLIILIKSELFKQIFIECLTYARHYSRCWDKPMNKTDDNSSLCKAY